LKILDKKILISDTLVTKLTYDQNSKETTRSNVHFLREAAENIQLSSTCGKYSVSINFNEHDRVINQDDDPSLFFPSNTVFANFFYGKGKKEFHPEHDLSKYVFFKSEVKKKEDNESLRLIQEIGQKSPRNWKWIPNTFYNEILPEWGKYLNNEIVPFEEYQRRIFEISNWDIQDSDQKRGMDDASGLSNIRGVENKFQVFSLAIPNNEKVTIVAKPIAHYGMNGEVSIQLVPFEIEENYHFQIVKGHNISKTIVLFKFAFYYQITFIVMLTILVVLYNVLPEKILNEIPMKIADIILEFSKILK
jgi:hypothetical protein